jgi:S-adenosylmethionine-diacylglycerol 3-amino-3-carboxypropyl transferase
MKRQEISRSYVSKLTTLNKVDYYTCWEDFLLIQKALQINHNDVIFSITSGGCNILNFLVYNPKRILAVDYNPYQNYLLELKIEAIKNFSYQQFLQFTGVTPSKERELLYGRIRNNLSKDARTIWDSNSYAIKNGVLHVGEQNVKNIGKFLRFLKGRDTIEKFFYCGKIEEQTDYFYKHVYGFPWRLYQGYTYKDYVVKLALCLRAIREYRYRRKRAAGYFRYIQKIHYPKNHLEKIEYVFTKIPIKYNHFASLILLGSYINEVCYPPYLKKENYEILKQRVDRIEIESSPVLETLKKFPDSYFTKFNLSNIFDWVDDNTFNRQLAEIIRVGKNEGKIFYSTTRTDRCIPKEIKTLSSDEQLATELLKEDRITLYSNFQIGTICK